MFEVLHVGMFVPADSRPALQLTAIKHKKTGIRLLTQLMWNLHASICGYRAKVPLITGELLVSMDP
jgi:hypothetical protein